MEDSQTKIYATTCPAVCPVFLVEEGHIVPVEDGFVVFPPWLFKAQSDTGVLTSPLDFRFKGHIWRLKPYYFLKHVDISGYINHYKSYYTYCTLYCTLYYTS